MVMAPRENFELLEDRLISGLGVIKIPEEDIYRYFRLWIDLVRSPDPDFFNGKWNPSRSEYAKVTWMAGEYVYKEDVIKYTRTVLDYSPQEPGAFLAPYLACSQESLSENICAILAGGGWGQCIPGDNIYVEPIRFPVDFLRFSCREESAFQLRLYGLKFDVECAAGTPSPKRQDEPPAPLPDVPSQDAIEVSAPYSEPNDDGNTIPYSGDVTPPPPPEYLGIITQYRLTQNCAQNPEPLTFVWEDTASPAANNVGGAICGDSFKWAFSPPPIGIIFGGVYTAGDFPALYGGGSNFAAVALPAVPITLP